MTDIDYGPLTSLMGSWEGEKGVDISPEPDGEENSEYYEKIVFAALDQPVSNAEEQDIAAIHYHQQVYRKSNNKEFHNETGYWMWDKASGVVIHSLTIPRGLSLVAGGRHSGQTDKDGAMVLEVKAQAEGSEWGIVESPFMRAKASTRDYTQTLTVKGCELSYSQTMTLDIYGRTFLHTDVSRLTKV